MAEPTFDDVDALVGPATPHFAYQMRARVRELVAGSRRTIRSALRRGADRPARPAGVRIVPRRGRRAREPRTRIGWDPIPSSAPADPTPKGNELRRRHGPRDGRLARDREGDRAAASRLGAAASRSATCAPTPPPRRRRRRSRARRGADPRTRQHRLAARAEEVAALGPLDALVHNAATGVIRPALETDDKHWDWTHPANARALLSLARAAAPSMPPGASIVGISSLGSTRVLENYALVGASKAALEALVRYLAVELAPRGIRVNAVSAGVVETGALEHFPNREAMVAMGARNPAGRIVSPEDVAAASRSSAPEADMVRGQTLVVDGGWSLLARRVSRHLERGRGRPRALRAHEALAGGRDERHGLREEHAHRVAQRERLLLRVPGDLTRDERRRRQLDRGVERERRELLPLRLLDRLRLLLRELAQPAEDLLGIAAEREEAAAFHAQ